MRLQMQVGDGIGTSQQSAADLAARLGTRLRRGIEVIVAASSH